MDDQHRNYQDYHYYCVRIRSIRERRRKQRAHGDKRLRIDQRVMKGHSALLNKEWFNSTKINYCYDKTQINR